VVATIQNSGSSVGETVNVFGPQVTDLWLDRLAVMKSLRQVQIGGAQVSDKSIAMPHRSLAEVQIYLEGRSR
jgi:hypothetical protein